MKAKCLSLLKAIHTIFVGSGRKALKVNFNNRDIYSRLGEILAADFDLEKRHSTVCPDIELDHLCSAVLEAVRDKPIVYTAFDGDHFHLCGHMRSFALLHDCVPANPESVLGYKDTVMARLTKAGVLQDDLTVLRGCDQLWVFTEEVARPESLQSLAEGVVIEVLFFLKRQRGPKVYFISPLSFLRGDRPPLIPFEFSYNECESALHSEQRDGVLELANSGMLVDKKLSSLIYHIYDPLDFKYAHWLRAYAYEGKRVPLVPGLAIGLADLGRSYEALGQILAAWVKLCQIATYAFLLPPMDSKRTQSSVAAILERVWLRTHSAETIQRRSWSSYPIPKARVGNRWPITKKEGGIR